MIIVWDEPKRQANLVKHGIDFAAIQPEFFLSAQVVAAKDNRWAAIGYLESAIVVIFATLGAEGISIISARPASRKERSILL